MRVFFGESKYTDFSTVIDTDYHTDHWFKAK